MAAKETPVKVKKTNPAKPSVQDSIKDEKDFQNKEEVALHQEDQKVKASMVSKSGRKRIFNSQGRR